MNFIEAVKAGVIKKRNCENRSFIFEKITYETTISDRGKDSINNLISMVLEPKKRVNTRHLIRRSKCLTMWAACETKKRAQEIIKELNEV